MKWFFNRCEHYSESISLLASGVLPEQEQPEVESHLAVCADCRKYHDQIKSLTVPLSGWESNVAHIEPDQAFRNRWTKAIQAAGEPEPVHNLPSKASTTFSQKLFSFRWHLAGMSAVWLMAMLLSADQSSTPASTVASQNAPSPQQFVTALRENRRQIADLLEMPGISSQPASLPPRRSESLSSTLMV